MRGQRYFIGSVDGWMLAIYLILIVAGWVNIYAAAFNPAHSSIFDFGMEYGKQFIWIMIALTLGMFILIIDPKVFSTFSYFIYAFSILLLVLTLIIGKEVNGSKSWIYFTEAIRFQPLELAKFATILILARMLGDIGVRMQDISTRIKALIIIVLPALLILAQNETGSVLVFVAFIFVLYREGLSGNILIIGFALILLFILSLLIDKYIVMGFITLAAVLLFFFIRKSRKSIFLYVLVTLLINGFVFSVDQVYEKVLEPHQKKRIDVLIGKETDLRGAGYNVNQSKIAIGSGGAFGKGFMLGTQTRFKFVPEQNTDFIFCTIGEEWGFAGTSVVIILYVIMLLRILALAERQRSAFSRIYGYGLASIIFFHVLINIGMTIGLAPVVGIPLPFVSYGGSSLLAFSVMFFVFLRLDAARNQVV